MNKAAPQEENDMAITINKLSPYIGAEIADIDLNEEQSAETVAEIVQAWHDNLILLFPFRSVEEPQAAVQANRDKVR